MEFYDIENCKLTGGHCIQEKCRWFRNNPKFPASCKAKSVILDNKELFRFLGKLTKKD